MPTGHEAAGGTRLADLHSFAIHKSLGTADHISIHQATTQYFASAIQRLDIASAMKLPFTVR